MMSISFLAVGQNCKHSLCISEQMVSFSPMPKAADRRVFLPKNITTKPSPLLWLDTFLEKGTGFPLPFYGLGRLFLNCCSKQKT